jgi:hypothetical protein
MKGSKLNCGSYRVQVKEIGISLTMWAVKPADISGIKEGVFERQN